MMKPSIQRVYKGVVIEMHYDLPAIQNCKMGGRTPQQLIVEGRIRDIVIEFDRLREGQTV